MTIVLITLFILVASLAITDKGLSNRIRDLEKRLDRGPF